MGIPEARRSFIQLLSSSIAGPLAAEPMRPLNKDEAQNPRLAISPDILREVRESLFKHSLRSGETVGDPPRIGDVIREVALRFGHEERQIRDLEPHLLDDFEKSAGIFSALPADTASREIEGMDQDLLLFRDFRLLNNAIQTLQQDDASFADVQKAAELISTHGVSILKRAADHVKKDSDMSFEMRDLSEYATEGAALDYIMVHMLDAVGSALGPIATQLSGRGI